MILQEKLLHFFPILSKPESYVAKFSFVFTEIYHKKNPEISCNADLNYHVTFLFLQKPSKAWISYFL